MKMLRKKQPTEETTTITYFLLHTSEEKKICMQFFLFFILRSLSRIYTSNAAQKLKADQKKYERIGGEE